MVLKYGLRYGLVGVFMFLLAYTEAQTPVLKEGFYPDGKLRYRGYFVGDQPSGEMKQFYPDGKIKAEMLHKGEETSVVLYSKSGEYHISGRYENKKRVGVWEYYQGERLLAGEEYVEGVLSGCARKYFRNGEILEEKLWKNGVPNGSWAIFYDNGQLRFKAMFVEGRLEGELTSWHYSGGVSAKGEYKQDIKEGEWVYYSEDGKVAKRVNYVHGVADSSEEDVLEASKKMDEFIKEGKRITDPADFTKDPEMYMRMME